MCRKVIINLLNLLSLKNKSNILFSSLIFLITLHCGIAAAVTASVTVTEETKTIGISQIIEHKALDVVRNSMLNTLKEEGFVVGKNLNLIYENAQGSMVTSTQIASKLVSSGADVLVGISTPSAQTLLQSAQKLDKKTPIVFTAVTNPKLAKLTPEISHYPITGISDAPNLKLLTTLLLELKPNLKKLGFLYNPSEINSVVTLEELKKILITKNIELIEAPVNNTADAPLATQSLINRVDMIYFPQDNTIVASMQSVINVVNQTIPIILPIYTDDPNILKGVVAANGYDYQDIGKETGLMIAKILKGQNPNTIPIQTPKAPKTIINPVLIDKLGLKYPTFKVQRFLPFSSRLKTFLSSGPGINMLSSRGRREPIPGGSGAASLLRTPLEETY